MFKINTLESTLYNATKHFQVFDDISKKFIPSLSIDEEISLWSNGMVLSGVIYHGGE